MPRSFRESLEATNRNLCRMKLWERQLHLNQDVLRIRRSETMQKWRKARREREKRKHRIAASSWVEAIMEDVACQSPNHSVLNRCLYIDASSGVETSMADVACQSPNHSVFKRCLCIDASSGVETSMADVACQSPNRNVLRKLAKTASDTSRPNQQLAAVVLARQVFSLRKRPVRDALQTGFLPILVNCLKQENHMMLQFEAAWTLTTIASDTKVQKNIVTRESMADVLVNLVASDSPNVWEQAVWALGNIIGDGPELRDFILKHDVLQPLLACVKRETSVSFLRNIAWLLMSLCRNRDPHNPLATTKKILPALKTLIEHTDMQILLDAMRSFCYLTGAADEQVELVIGSGVVPRIISLLGHAEPNVQAAAIQVVGTIVASLDKYAQYVLDHNALSYFPSLLRHQRQKIRKEAIWVLSNFLGGTNLQIKCILKSGLLPHIIENLCHSEFQVQKEAVWAISNVTFCGKREYILTVIREGAIPPFCDLLTCQDAKIVKVVLQGLKNMLENDRTPTKEVAQLIEHCDGLEKLEELQRHESEEIYKLALEIIEKHFSCDAATSEKPANTEQNAESRRTILYNFLPTFLCFTDTT